MNDLQQRYSHVDNNDYAIREMQNSREVLLTRRKIREQRKYERRKKNIVRFIWFLVIVSVIYAGFVMYRALFLDSSPSNSIATNPPDNIVVTPNVDNINSAGTTDVKSNTDDNNSVDTTDVKSDADAIVPIEKENESPIDDSKFTGISYCKSDRLSRYKEYSIANPNMSAEDVVWRVNANLDKPKYQYDIPTSGYDNPLIIVNKFYKVPEDYRPPDLESFDGQLMRHETGEAYTAMRNAASQEGLNIRAVSAYRSVEYQRNLYNSYLANDVQASVDRYSARPGYSEHHTGMAIDFFGSIDGLRNFEYTPEYTWLKENGYKFGFIIRYTPTGEEITGYESEPWHVRYVGVEVSTDMRNKNIDTFEEYYAKYLM